MEINLLISKGNEISQFYYSAQKYFSKIILLAEGVANLLADKGWKITGGISGRPLNIYSWDWRWDRGALFPKCFIVRFKKGDVDQVGDSTCPIDNDQYGMSLWFFNSDPEGEIPWVPIGYFFRITVLEGNIFEDWKVDPKIAQVIRPLLLEPTLESCFVQFPQPIWPSKLAGDGVDNLLKSIMVVPFPLAAIENSEDLEIVTNKAVRALSDGNSDLLTSDEEFRRRIWGI
jgi:hypothetical protein